MSQPDLSDLLDRDRPPRERMPVEPTPWRVYLGYGLLVASVVGAVLFAMAPSPYVVERPGPVFDVLGVVESGGESVPLIDIEGETTYPTGGELDMLTVYIDGSRENPLSWLEVAQAWFDPSRAVLPIDLIYPDGQSDEEADQQSAQQMDTSQQDAVAAALGQLEIPVDSTVVIDGVIEGAPAEGVLEAGDTVLTAGGVRVTDVDGLRAALADAGVGNPVALGIERDGLDTTEIVVPVASQSDGSAVIGVYVSARYAEFPIDVTIQLDNVGGPSAGMMFALGIYDKLTPGELAGGEHIAGTGTIDGSGLVGAIGGIVQKMYGAQDAGADWFLAPASNCSEVIGHIPGELEVFSVETLDDAVTAVEAIADGDTAELARCG